MPISAEGVRYFFAEQAGRQIDFKSAEAVAGVASGLIDGLNALPEDLLAAVEPSLSFQAGYARKKGEGHADS